MLDVAVVVDPPPPLPPPLPLPASAGETSRAKIATVAAATKSFLIPILPCRPGWPFVGMEAGTYLKGIGRG